MKIKELFENEDNGSLIGKTINGKLITKETKNTFWDGDFICQSLNLPSLEGAPREIRGRFNCSMNENLTSLEGAPKKIMGDFVCRGNLKITSLKGIHKIIEEINDTIYLTPSIESNILGLLKIKNLKEVCFHNYSFDNVKEDISGIINKYLPNPTPDQIIDCQNELIDAGFEEYAEL